ncbi:hypothetical protein LMG26411_01578 [Cupriavidus numazuensis]|uniref:Transposase n=1 Tax=Cupriavidus numazuensis TaxID=221992 RepID=A0ABM8TDT7_9BURK|nr:hypothetical protein LMG26411_01578 [Cupriavidus numazuensis]
MSGGGVALGMRRGFAGVAGGPSRWGWVITLRWRGCFAGVAGESLFVRATKSNQKARRCRWPSIPRRQGFKRLWTPATVVSGSTLLRYVSQNLCLARHDFWTIPKTDSGTAFQHGQWWDAFGCAARTSSSGGKLISVAGARVPVPVPDVLSLRACIGRHRHRGVVRPGPACSDLSSARSAAEGDQTISPAAGATNACRARSISAVIPLTVVRHAAGSGNPL